MSFPRNRFALTLLLPTLLLVGFCVACDGTETLEAHTHRLEVPSGWHSDRRVDGPRQTVTLWPDDSFVCELSVIRDGRTFADRDAEALVGDAMRVFGATERSPLDASLLGGEGIAAELSPVTPRSAWPLSPEAPTKLQIVARASGTELLTAFLAWSGPRPAEHALCRRMLELEIR